MLAGTLEIQLLADVARLQKDMDEAKRSVGTAMSSIQKSVDVAKTAIASLAAGLSVHMFVDMIRGAIDVADNLNDLSKTTGIAVAQLTGLKLAAKQSGGDLEGIAQSINTLSVNMAKDSERFAKLGISAKDPLEAFKQLSDVFVSIKDPQLRAAVGAEALGKSWASAAPLLSEGGKSIARMVEKGMQLSHIEQEMASNADEFNDKLAEMEAASEGMKMKIVGSMLPAMTDAIKAMALANEESGKLKAAWVALGGLGAFLFTDEFSSATVKIENLKKEVAWLENKKKEQEQSLKGGGYLQQWLFGGSAEETQKQIDSAIKQIEQLQNQMNKPAEDAKTKKQLEEEAAAAKDAEEKAKAFLKLNEEKLKKQDEFIKSLTKEHDTLVLGEKQSKLNEAATLGIVGAKLKHVKALLDEIDAYKQAQKDAEKHADLRRKEEEEINSYFISQQEGYNAQVKASKEALKSAQDEYDQFGLSKSQIAELTLLKLKDAQASYTEGSAGFDAIQKQIDNQKELIEILKKTEVREEWKSIFESIETTAHDTFLSIFDSGKNAFDRLRDTLKNGLLELLYQVSIKKWILNLETSFTGTSGAAVQAGSSGLLNLLGSGSSSSGSSILSGASKFFGSSYGTTAPVSASGWTSAEGGLGYGADGSFIPALGGALSAYGMSKKYGALGGLAAGAGSVALGGAISGGLAGGSMAAAGAGATGALSALGPWGWAAIAAMALLGGMGGGETRFGAGYNIDKSTGKALFAGGPSGGAIGGGSVEQMISAAYGAINSTLRAVGSKAMIDQFTAGLETSEKGKGGTFAGGVINGTVFGKRDQEKVYNQNLSAEDAIKQLGVDLKRASIQALQAAADIPKSISDQIKGIDASGLSEEAATSILETISTQIEAVGKFKQALESLPFSNLKDLSFDLASSLMQFSGGIENMQNELADFQKNYYSDAERSKIQAEQVAKQMDQLGYSSIKTKEQFRALVDGFKITDDASAKIYAGLLAVEGAFAQVADSANFAADASKNAIAAGDAARKDASIAIDNAKAAFDVLSKSIEAEKSKLQIAYDKESASIKERIDAAKSIANAQSEVAQQNLRELGNILSQVSGAVDELRPMTYKAAQNNLQSAINYAKGGGSLVGFAGLEDSIKASQRIDENNYATALDMKRDQARSASLLSQLKDYAKSQTDVAQLTLDAINSSINEIELNGRLQLSSLDQKHAEDLSKLDAQLDTAQKQLEELQGIKSVELSLVDAIKAFSSAVEAAKANPVISSTPILTQAYNDYLKREPDQAGLQNAQNQISAGTPVQTIVDSIKNSNEAAIQNLYQSVLGRTGETAGVNFWLDKLNSGQSIDSIQEAFYSSDEYQKKVLGYASGGQHPGGWRIVGERGWEMEYTGASSIVNHSDSMKMLDNRQVVEVLKEELKAVRKELIALRQTAEETNLHSEKTSNILNNATEGGRAFLTEAYS